MLTSHWRSCRGSHWLGCCWARRDSSFLGVGVGSANGIKWWSWELPLQGFLIHCKWVSFIHCNGAKPHVHTNLDCSLSFSSSHTGPSFLFLSQHVSSCCSWPSDFLFLCLSHSYPIRPRSKIIQDHVLSPQTHITYLLYMYVKFPFLNIILSDVPSLPVALLFFGFL